MSESENSVGPAPSHVSVQTTVDGWSVTLPDSPRGKGLWQAALGLALVGAGTVVYGLMDTTSGTTWLWIGGASALVGAVGWAGLYWSRAPSKTVLHIHPSELRIDGLKGSPRVRVQWHQVSPPKVADLRDEWTKTWDSQHALHDANTGQPLNTDLPKIGVRLRWTTDGTPAAHAHHLTPWASAGVGPELGPTGAAWLASAVEHAQRQAKQMRINADFDDAREGGASEKAHAKLLNLLDRED